MILSIWNVIVDFKYYCRFEKLKPVWIIISKIWKISFDFKDKFIDLKYSYYRFEMDHLK